MLALSPDYYPVLASDLAVERGGGENILKARKGRGRENISRARLGGGINDKKYGEGRHGPSEKGGGERSGTSSETNWQGGKEKGVRTFSMSMPFCLDSRQF